MFSLLGIASILNGLCGRSNLQYLREVRLVRLRFNHGSRMKIYVHMDFINAGIIRSATVSI